MSTKSNLLNVNTKCQEEANAKEKIAILGAVLIITISCFLPEMEYLSIAGIRTIGLIIAFILLLVTNALPLSITCWIVLGLMPLIGVSTGFGAALTGFSNPVMFFILASFGISTAFITLPLSKRILVVLLRKFGKNMKSMLFAFMLCILPITAFVSSVPVAAMFLAIALSFLELFDDEEAKRITGKTFMIAIPVTALFGGIATPAGSAINLLAIGLLEQHTGQTISFVQWMFVGIPLVLLIFPIAWLLIYKVYKPTEINPDMVRAFINRLEITPKMSIEEKKVLIIMVSMVILWILSSWFTQINIVVVALLGICAMFLPGIKVLEWKTFIKNVNFDVFFLVGTTLCLGSMIVNNGVSDWITTMFPTIQMSLPMLIAFTVIFVFMVLIIMPVGPSVVVFLAVPLITLAQSMGYNSELIILTLAVAAGNCYLLPLDTVPLITYGSGYYSMLDMTKSTLPLQIYVVGIITLVFWIAGGIFSII